MCKDTISFINSIGYSNFEKSVTTFFDENMALYNLLGSYSDLQINGEVNGSTIKFCLHFGTIEDTKKMYDILFEKVLYIFNREFRVKEVMSDNNNIIVEFI